MGRAPAGAPPQAQHVQPRVAADLAPLVTRLQGYAVRGMDPGEHVGLPSTAVTLILSLDEGVDVARMPRADRSPGRFRALVGGLHDGPVGIRHDGAMAGIQLDLTPAGVRALLGLPAAAVAREVVDLAECWGRGPTDALLGALEDATTWQARLDLLGAALRSRAAGARPADDVVTAAVARLCDPADRRPVADTAASVGWTRRTLTARVTAETGLAPVVLRSLARFDAARRDVAAGGRPLTQVAADHGYADQAHMTREFRRFAGKPPTRWLAEEDLPSVQAAAGQSGG